MKTLLLLRHAKAVASQPSVDHDRALSPQGQRDAAALAPMFDRPELRPDLALVSDARRTRETVGAALSAMPTERIRFESALYAASDDEILDAVRMAPEDVTRVLVVGHNPGIGDLARRLAGAGDAAALSALGRAFPTAALAVIDTDAATWAEVGRKTGTLRLFAARSRE